MLISRAISKKILRTKQKIYKFTQRNRVKYMFKSQTQNVTKYIHCVNIELVTVKYRPICILIHMKICEDDETNIVRYNYENNLNCKYST